MKKIRVAIAGVGNCASSLVQGLEYLQEPQRGIIQRSNERKDRRMGAERYRDRGRL